MRHIVHLTNRLIIQQHNYAVAYFDRDEDEDDSDSDRDDSFNDPAGNLDWQAVTKRCLLANSLHNYETVHIEIYSDCLTSLTRFDLKNYQRLQTLRIEAIKVCELAAKQFEYCKHLRCLYLELGIRKIGVAQFEQLRDLVRLQLITKHLRNIPEKIFQHNRSLEQLELHYFSTGQLAKIFSQLKKLKVLKLFNYNREDWGNEELITADHFSNQKQLKHLSLKYFDFSMLQPRLFHYLQKTRAFIVHKSHLHGLEDDEGGVLLYRLKNLRHLNLRENRISNLKKTSFLYNEKLKAIDMDSNSVQELKTVTFGKGNVLGWLNMAKNQVSNLKNTFFTNLHYLVYLNLSQNRIVQIHELTFIHVHNLNVLDLSRNIIQAIDRRAFINLSKLQVLRLESNRFTELQPFVFHGQFELNSLNLNKCRLETLDSIFFGQLDRDSFDNFEVLHCRQNGVKTIETKFFAMFPALKTIDLSGNELDNLSDELFVMNSHLEKVDLHANRLSQVPQRLFQRAWDLKLLNLSNNRIVDIEPRTFRRLFFLESLNLNYNRIRAVDTNWFRTNQYLRYLSINNNKLESFDFALITQTLIKTIDVSENPIRDINAFYISDSLSCRRKLFVDADFMSILRKKRRFFSFGFIGELVRNVNSTGFSDVNLMKTCHEVHA